MAVNEERGKGKAAGNATGLAAELGDHSSLCSSQCWAITDIHTLHRATGAAEGFWYRSSGRRPFQPHAKRDR